MKGKMFLAAAFLIIAVFLVGCTGEAIKTKTGSLYVTSNPSTASIYIDDMYKGTTPKTFASLQIGDYKVKVNKSGYEPHYTTAKISAGKTTKVSANLTKQTINMIDRLIPVDPGFPPGGVSYINWEFENNFERLDVDVNIIKFDTSKYLYLQFYQSTIGEDGFYFGIQNRVDENDQMLIFSRWGTRDLADVKVNSAEGGFNQSAGYEGDFVGVRLPNFNLKNGEYTFSIIKDQDDAVGSWYKYMVTDKSTGIQTWGGSIRFDKGAKINKLGGTWTELYGAPWQIQTYRYLPTWDVEIKSIKGDSILPLHATSSYSDQTWGDHIPMEDISYNPISKSIRMQLGPYVLRKNEARRIY